ncbi:MAG TPA: 16S rRNA (cytidine(1402)-2'-O)-methyltransferase [Steroidobacteraceae bacterium]
MATLYIVSTPIGNLADMTFRAVETLRSVSRILAEDTRRTGILLRHYSITTPMVSAHEHNEAARAARIITWLEEGQDLAIVSDAGTPLLSDPGARIVQAVLSAGHDVVPIPGASALLAALVASGLEPEPFTFWGFLPRSGRERKDRLAEVGTCPHTGVLYEAPGRVGRLLSDLLAACGTNRRAVVARELTKLHETFVRGTLQDLVSYYENEAVRGEVVVLLEGAPAETPEAAEAEAFTAAREMITAGQSPRDVAREITRRFQLPRNRAYEIAHAVRNEKEETE